jgi:DNA-binding beta-propeller fold protein YncE
MFGLEPQRPRHTASELRPGSDPRALPGNVLIADRANNRLLEVTPEGKIVWRFPRPGDLHHGQTFRVPDDAFFNDTGSRIVATEEDDFVISVIDVARERITYRYGHPGVPGSGPGFVHNPDDAIPLRNGKIVSADIKNCRLIELRPPVHRPIRQLGATGGCIHDPPRALSSPNGAFPLFDGGTVVTEIGGVWADVLDRWGRLTAAVSPPGFSYPSDTNEVRPGVLLSVDYAKPGAILEFGPRGHVLWHFAPRGRDALNHPSLALPLPNGDVLANDDFNDRVIVVDPHTNRIVWQYGHTGVPGRRPGYLNVPDGVDLAPPYALADRFRNWTGLPG